MSSTMFLLHLLTYSFMTLSFCQLIVLQLGEYGLRPAVWGGWTWRFLLVVFAIYSCCQLAALLMFVFSDGRVNGLSTPGRIVFMDAFACIAPLLMHLFYTTERATLPRPVLWKAFFCAAYGANLIAAGVGTWALLTGQYSKRLGELVWTMIDGMLLPAALFVALAVMLSSRKEESLFRRRRRHWYGILGGVFLSHYIIERFWWPSGLELLTRLLPLAFVFVTTYFGERLACFDVFVKRGCFFFSAILVFTGWFGLMLPYLQFSRLRVFQSWAAAIAVIPLLALAPWFYQRISRQVDRFLLGRRMGDREAAAYLSSAVQGAADEGELLTTAEKALAGIFQSQVTIDEEPPRPADALAHSSHGITVHLWARPDETPFLSADHALLEHLAERLGFHVENLRSQQWQQQLILDKARAELKALRAQINPHFLFNALSAIAGLITQRPDVAEQTVEQLADVFRYTLRRSDREWVRLEEEVEFVRAYLDVEKARFGNRLTVRVTMDESAQDIRIPAMVVGTLAENAIKHGVASVRGPGVVAVTAFVRNGCVEVAVEDSGPGFAQPLVPGRLPESRTGGYGLRNVCDRLHAYYGARAAMRFDRRDGMTVVSLNLPSTSEGLKT